MSAMSKDEPPSHDPESNDVSGRHRATACTTCPHACKLRPGDVGLCRARGWQDGSVQALSYGRITSLALDPVEKKPLARWNPGKLLLSAGSYGCNLHCPFCQNHTIAQAGSDDVDWRFIAPGRLVEIANQARATDPRVVGIAHTYNEPLVAWEYVGDVGMLAHRLGLANVIVSNGCVRTEVVNKIAPLIDAANIDLKGFTEDYYRWCGGDLATVQACIERLVTEPGCHVEVTCLVVPGRNDAPNEMRDLARWLAGVDPDITLHVTRFFPRWKLCDGTPTPRETVYELAEVAREHLAHVFVGNC